MVSLVDQFIAAALSVPFLIWPLLCGIAVLVRLAFQHDPGSDAEPF
jgi:hypothetical protein